MLCKRIVFTDEMIDCINDVAEIMRNQGINHNINAEINTLDIDEKINNELLYGLCCVISNYLVKKTLRSEINRFLMDDFDFFNNDERKIIVNNVLEKEFVKELPGRMYVYLRINPQFNPWGFYRFMCKDIHDALLSDAIKEAGVVASMNDEENFIGLLRNFSKISMSNADVVRLECTSGRMHITPHGSKFREMEFSSDDADILTELVTLNPDKIQIIDKEEFYKNEIATVIAAVFNDRIEFR